MSDRFCTPDEIRSVANPVTQRYNIAALYLFGYYVRGKAAFAAIWMLASARRSWIQKLFIFHISTKVLLLVNL